MKKYFSVAAYVFAALCFAPLLLAFALIKDVPSIHDHKAPYCEGKYSSVNGKYLSFDQLPPDTLRVLAVAEPKYKYGVVQMLQFQMPHLGNLGWALRGLLLKIWIQQYKESDLIEFYLNGQYFGDGCYGIDAAAKAYFKKELNALSLEETAQILALPKSPSSYSITEHPDSNKERAHAILRLLQGQELSHPAPK
jgi:hypothetical protein